MYYSNVLKRARTLFVSLFTLAVLVNTQTGCGEDPVPPPSTIPGHDTPMVALNGTFESAHGWAPLTCEWDSDASLRSTSSAEHGSVLAIVGTGCIVESSPIVVEDRARFWLLNASFLFESGGCIGACGLVWIRWYDGSLAFLSEESHVLSSDSAEQWRDVTASGSIPAGARFFRIALRGVPAMEASTTILVDNITVHQE